MRDSGAARRYAKAAIDSAENHDQLIKIGEELNEFSTKFTESVELKNVLIHPGIKLENKIGVVKEVASAMGFSDKFNRILMIILENGRMNLISEIASAYSDMADEELKQVRVKISSAMALNDSEKSSLEDIFSNITGKSALLEINVDKNLIGGVVARVGSKVYDGSLSNQLRLVRVKLEQEA